MSYSKFISLILIVFTSIILCAQAAFSQTNLDSLWNVWNDPSQNDTARLQAIHKIAGDGYMYSQPDSAFYFTQLEYDFAKSKGLKKQMAQALNAQGVSSWLLGNYDTAIDYYNRSLSLREKIGDKEGIASSINNIGIIYYERGDYDATIDYWTRSLNIREEIGVKPGIATSLLNIGAIYLIQGNYISAINFYTRSLTIYEEIGDKRGIANCLNNIGIINKNQNNFDIAIHYYNRCLVLMRDLGDKHGMAIAYDNIGTVYAEKNDLENSLIYFNQGLTNHQEIGNEKGIAFSSNSIGIVYQKEGDYSKALEYFGSGLDIFERIGDKIGIAISFNSFAEIYQKKNDHKNAIEYSSRAMDIATELEAAEIAMNAANILYTSYKAIGRSRLSLEMYELYIATRDSVDSEKNQKEVIRQKYKYDYEKQALADSISYAQVQVVQEAKLEKSRILQYALIGGVTLLLVFLVYVFNRFKVTQKQKLIISEQNKELATATNHAESANSALQTKSKELEKFNNVMLDREMRIIELKKEANKIAESNNKELPYPEVGEV